MTYMGCDGPGMHRLQDALDNVVPCACCGRHHFGPRGQIEDSSVEIYRGQPLSFHRLLGRLVCGHREHAWQTPEPYRYGHVQHCARCDATRMTVPVSVVGDVGEPYALHGRDPVPPRMGQ